MHSLSESTKWQPVVKSVFPQVWRNCVSNGARWVMCPTRTHSCFCHPTLTHGLRMLYDYHIVLAYASLLNVGMTTIWCWHSSVWLAGKHRRHSLWLIWVNLQRSRFSTFTPSLRIYYKYAWTEYPYWIWTFPVREVLCFFWVGGLLRLSLAVGFVELSAAKALKDGRLLSSCTFKVVFRLQSMGNNRPVCHMTAIHC